jgi:hypothetical protein
MNARCFLGTVPPVVKKDSQVRIRIGDLGAMAAAQKQAAPDKK